MSSPQGKKKCLPVYLVVDTSGSMDAHTDLLNKTVQKVFTTVADSPRVAEFAHVSIITFNTTPHVVLEMTNLEEVSRLPLLACQGMTNYGSMFELLKKRIDADVVKLNSTGRGVLRPAAFILTDGVPSDKDDWAKQYSVIADRSWNRRPHIVSFGFGRANDAVLGRIANKGAFRAEISDTEAITTMLATLLHTLVQSATAQELRIPIAVPGYRSVPMDEYVE